MTALAAKANFNDAWNLLHEGLDIIFLKHGKQFGLNKTTYMKYYTTVYDYATRTSRPLGHMGSPSQPIKQSGANIAGAEMYEKLQAYVQSHCEDICKKLQGLHHEDLLGLFTAEWDTFTFSSKVANNVCNYLNRHFVHRSREEKNFHVNYIDKLCLILWRRHTLQPVQEAVIGAVLELIRKDREGDKVQTSLIQQTCQCLVAVGIEEEDTGQSKDHAQSQLKVYQSMFEKPFLEKTIDFYKMESQEFLHNNSISDYMKQVESRLEQEDARVQAYLHDSTREPLNKTITEALIESHIDILKAELKTLMEEERTSDLKRMYLLLSRLPKALKPLMEGLEQHVASRGRAAIEKCGKLSTSSEDAKIYVDTLLQVHRKYSVLVKEAFNNDASFVAAFDKACRTFVNSNAITKASKTSQGRSPELLAKYCDSLLKKSSKNPEEDQLEKLLSDLMVIFKYIDDKDVFEKFYKKLLAKRLVTGASASDDAEASMISKLKEACGYEYTSKLQRMFNDVGVSKDTNAKFKEHLEQSSRQKLSIDMSVQILSNGAWPFQPPPEMQLPPELLECIDRFQTFYNSEHQGRKLTWLHHYSKGDLKTLYTKKPYVFQASTMQMTILLQFNTYDSLTMAELGSHTGIKPDMLDAHLQQLVKMKILKDKGGTITVNEDYSYKKLRVKIDLPIKMEQKAESEATHKDVEEDRKLAIQACMVRIMKARKVMKHAMLIQEAVQQLSSRFQPKIPVVKKCIDLLIEKEYLRRKEGTRDEYEYLA